MKREDSFIKEKKGIDRKNLFLMALITGIFAVLVLFRLGSCEAPQSGVHLESGKGDRGEIVLDFGKEVYISKVHIYLGYKSGRRTALSYAGKETRGWKTFDENCVIESPFTWNEKAVNHNLSNLGIVLLEDEADFLEIVCIDLDGNIVKPVNTDRYPKLFDEQDLFTDHVTYYEGTMFDEVYHGRTAYEFIHHYDIYEDTHPPLGKTIISLGIRLFGMTPFGWRIMCAVCGILLVAVMYLFGLKMTGKSWVAAFAAVLLSTMFMNYTLSRIATVDIIVALFVMIMLGLMYGLAESFERELSVRRQLPWSISCGIAMGLAISTKWTGIYASAGATVIFFVFLWKAVQHKGGIGANKKYLIKLAFTCVICFIVVPLSIYVLSYIPFKNIYPDKGLIQIAIENGQRMLEYHSSVFDTHPYESVWYEWLVDKRPLLDAYTDFGDGTISVVATFVNPFICIGGLIGAVYQVYLFVRYRDHNALFLIIAYISVLGPWVLVARTVFIYQYFLGALILVLMLANSAYRIGLRSITASRVFMAVFATVATGLFILYFPVISGIRTDYDFVADVLQIMDSWTFTL